MVNHPNRRKREVSLPLDEILYGDDSYQLASWLGGLIDWIKADMNFPVSVERLLCQTDFGDCDLFDAHTGARLYQHDVPYPEQEDALRKAGYSFLRDYAEYKWGDERRLAAAYLIAYYLSPRWSAAGQAGWASTESFSRGFQLGAALATLTPFCELSEVKIAMRPFKYPKDDPHIPSPPT